MTLSKNISYLDTLCTCTYVCFSMFRWSCEVMQFTDPFAENATIQSTNFPYTDLYIHILSQLDTHIFLISCNVSNTGTIAPQVNQQVTHHHHSHLINKLSINALRMTVDCGMVWLESPDQMSEYISGLCRYKYISQ